jgi:hypothetical protein
MNRNDQPDLAAAAVAIGELLVTARRTVAAYLTAQAAGSVIGPAVAVEAVRAAVEPLWPRIPPEAARDVMVSMAAMACEHGVTTVPADVTARYPGQLDAADGLLELTSTSAPAAAGPHHFTPAAAYASSVAFDRDEDDATLVSLAALAALAHIANRDVAWPLGAEGDDSDDDEEPF